MKKIVLLLSMILGITVMFAQNKIKGNGIVKEVTRSISGYDAVKLKSSFDVILTDEQKEGIRIVGEENIIPLIVSNLNGKELELSFKPNTSITYNKKLQVYVPSKDINKISLLGSGGIENQGTLNAKKLVVELSGSGDINLKNINAEKMETILKGSGDIDLKGIAKEISVNLKGSGDISAFGLKTEKSVVELVGSGDVEVYSTKEFTGKLNGSGDIKVKGNPTKVSKIRKGSGDISVSK